MNIPKDLMYTKEHEWIAVEGDTATVGITDFAQDMLGDIVFVDIASLGHHLGKDEVFGSVEAVKTVSDLFLPVAGEITDVNSELESKPELVNSDPYGSGWMVKMKLKDVSQLETLLSAEKYYELIR